MPPEKVDQKLLLSVRDELQKKLTPDLIKHTQAIIDAIKADTSQGITNNQKIRKLLSVLSNDQLQYIIVHTNCSNIQNALLNEISLGMATERDALLWQAEFALTSQPDWQSSVNY